MKNFLKNISLLFCSIIVALLLGEGMIRVYENLTGEIVKLYTIDYFQTSTIPELHFELKPNYESIGGRTFDKGVLFKINSCGFRGDEGECKIFDTLNNFEGLSIITIGDSYTLGQSVNAEDVYSKVLEKYLHENGITSIVLNFGVSSYNCQQEFSLLKYKIIENNKKPDVIVWQFLLNDYRRETELYKAYHPFKRKFKKYSHTFRLFDNMFMPKKFKLTYRELRKSILNEYEKAENLEFIKKYLSLASKELQKNGIEGVFLYAPYLAMFTDWDEYSDDFLRLDQKIISIAKESGWENIVYSYDTLQKYPFKEVVLDIDLDHHPNKKGHEILGTLLGKKILDLYN